MPVAWAATFGASAAGGVGVVDAGSGPRVLDVDPVVVDGGPAQVDDTAPLLHDAGPAVEDPAADRASIDAAADESGDDPAAQNATIVDAGPVTDDPAADGAKAIDVVPIPVVVEPLVDPRSVPDPLPAPPAADDDEAETGWGFGGVPVLGYSADNGVLLGAVASLFFYDGETRPYRSAVTLQLVVSSRLVQDHALIFDMIRAFDLPLRLRGRLGYLQSLTQNYCGLGGDVTCDPGVARRVGLDEGLGGDALDAFASRYYLRRFHNPYAFLTARWMLRDLPHRVELLGGWRGAAFIPGGFDDDDGDGTIDLVPYPGSLYEQDFPAGEPGFSSTFTVGVVVDDRDNEPAPTRGYIAEASLRAATPFWGSTWTYGGANITARGYVPLDNDRKLILAARLIVDAIVGDIPIQELARIGGTEDHYIFGGQDIGRGVRVQRYLGKLRVAEQTELRWRFWDFALFDQQFGLTGVGFVDAGIVGREILDPGDMPPIFGFGGALRVAWNENFIVRADLGFSPAENYAPSLYLLLGHPF